MQLVIRLGILLQRPQQTGIAMAAIAMENPVPLLESEALDTQAKLRTLYRLAHHQPAGQPLHRSPEMAGMIPH